MTFSKEIYSYQYLGQWIKMYENTSTKQVLIKLKTDKDDRVLSYSMSNGIIYVPALKAFKYQKDIPYIQIKYVILNSLSDVKLINIFYNKRLYSISFDEFKKKAIYPSALDDRFSATILFPLFELSDYKS